MKRVLTAALVFCCVPLALAQDTENPFKKAKVGDWAEYKMSTNVKGFAIDASMKMTVTDKNDKEVTLKTSIKIMDMDLPGQETKVDLTKPFDPLSTANIPKGTKAKVEKAGEGKEKITVGGKTYECTWMKLKIAAEVKGVNLDSEVKVWMSKTVPMSGMVKMEMKSNLADMTMELTNTGSK